MFDSTATHWAWSVDYESIFLEIKLLVFDILRSLFHVFQPCEHIKMDNSKDNGQHFWADLILPYLWGQWNSLENFDKNSTKIFFWTLFIWSFSSIRWEWRWCDIIDVCVLQKALVLLIALTHCIGLTLDVAHKKPKAVVISFFLPMEIGSLNLTKK